VLQETTTTTNKDAPGTQHSHQNNVNHQPAAATVEQQEQDQQQTEQGEEGERQHYPPPVTLTFKLNDSTVSEDLFSFLAYELGDEWLQLANNLNVKKARLQVKYAIKLSTCFFDKVIGD
jgi:hypothetical protein